MCPHIKKQKHSMTEATDYFGQTFGNYEPFKDIRFPKGKRLFLRNFLALTYLPEPL